MEVAPHLKTRTYTLSIGLFLFFSCKQTLASNPSKRKQIHDSALSVNEIGPGRILSFAECKKLKFSQLFNWYMSLYFGKQKWFLLREVSEPVFFFILLT